MLIVSSLAAAKAAFAAHQPVKVISVLSQDEVVPEMDGLDARDHLQLYVERDACSSTIGEAAKKRVRQIAEFIKDWDGDGDILVHCNRGVSRSMAAAYIIMCLARPDDDEAALAAELRAAAPYADPCLMMIAQADDFLERDGRMLDAIEDLAPPCANIATPVVTLPLAA